MSDVLDKIAAKRADEFWQGFVDKGECPELSPIIRTAIQDALQLVCPPVEGEHSPLPWQKSEFPHVILNAKGDTLAAVFRDADEATASRSLILRAVNSHHKLVEAVRDLLAYQLDECNCAPCADAAPCPHCCARAILSALNPPAQGEDKP